MIKVNWKTFSTSSQKNSVLLIFSFDYSDEIVSLYPIDFSVELEESIKNKHDHLNSENSEITAYIYYCDFLVLV